MNECFWRKEKSSDGDVYYEASCGEAHEFTHGTPKENKYKFCPYCGGKIITVIHKKAGE